jgi:carboxyl-terminal processing protease
MKRPSIVSGAVGALAALVAWSVFANAKTGPANSYEDLGLLADVYEHVKQNYVNEVDEPKLIEGAIKGMLATLDPHTSYLPEELYSEMQSDTRGEFEGLGIEISKRDGFVTVVSPIDGTPASRAGIKGGDQIVAVCPDSTEQSCKSTQDMDLTEAVRMMRGKRGTKILIQIMRKGWPGPKPFTIKRDSIQVTSVEMQLIDGSIPYIRLKQFAERASADISRNLADARKQAGGPIKGMILDLRDNPGGLLDQAVAVADLFLNEGVIVTSEGRDGRERGEWRARPENTEVFEPVVVLVNGGSASASEIVAGALQDHKRALVVGSETFGKGSVQTIIPLRGNKAGLRLTTQLYYLPTGRSIQEKRIKPDITVEQLSQEELDARKNARRERAFGEENLENHLRARGGNGAAPAPANGAAPAPTQTPVPATAPESRALPPTPAPADKPEAEQPPLSREEAFKQMLQNDNQLIQAIGYLKSIELLSQLRPPTKAN